MCGNKAYGIEPLDRECRDMLYKGDPAYIFSSGYVLIDDIWVKLNNQVSQDILDEDMEYGTPNMYDQANPD